MDNHFRPYFAELIGTFILVFLGAAAVCADQLALQTAKPELGLVGIALAYGLGQAVGMALATPHQTGYLNPAITLTLWVYKRIDGRPASLFMAAQLIGAALAGLAVRLVFAGNDLVLSAARLGTPHINLANWNLERMTVAALPGALAIEIFLTFILTLVVFGTLIDPRAPRLLGALGRWLSPLWVGLCGVALTLCGYAMTGAAANPARWLGTVIWEQTVDALRNQHPFSDNMVYWVGPIVGALAAGGAYTNLLLREGATRPSAEPTA
jgi:glycerol uptake facilitator-like aquaporin